MAFIGFDKLKLSSLDGLYEGINSTVSAQVTIIKEALEKINNGVNWTGEEREAAQTDITNALEALKNIKDNSNAVAGAINSANVSFNKVEY